MPSLPVDGATGWGDTLNTYLNALSAEANSTQSTLNSHAANSPADPHGDRAYAQTLVNPITTGVNSANGYVKLNGSGFIPAALVNGAAATGGAYTNIYDAVTMYGAVANNGLDQSTAIQNAINAAGTAGGGIVYLGDGTFSLATYLVMQSNVWLAMNPATVLQRIVASTNAPYLITNIVFNTSSTPATNIRITGGKLNNYGTSSITSACTDIFLIQAHNSVIENVQFYNGFNTGPCIEVNGCNNVTISKCAFDGIGSSSTNALYPAIRVNLSITSTTPSGLAAGLYGGGNITNGLAVSNCQTVATGSTHGSYASIVGSDKTGAGGSNTNINIIGCVTKYASVSGPVNAPNSFGWTLFNIESNTWFEMPALNFDTTVFTATGTTPTVVNNSYPMLSTLAGTKYRLKVPFIGSWGASLHVYCNLNGSTNIQLTRIHSSFGTSGQSVAGVLELNVLVTSATTCDMYLTGTIGNLSSNSGYLVLGNNIAIATTPLTSQAFSYNSQLALAIAFESSSGSLTTEWSDFELNYPCN